MPTQMTSARRGIATDEMKQVAKDEDVTLDWLLPKIASGSIIIPSNNVRNEKIYHHCGIYSFTKDALEKYVKLPRSKLEIERNLEQMRAMESNMQIKVGLSNYKPLSVDTEEDLKNIEKEMKNNE